MENVGLSKYSLIISSNYRAALESLAAKHGFMWGDRGNVKGLIEALARGDIPIGSRTTLSAARQSALVRAAVALRDCAESTSAREVVGMLSEYELLPELLELIDFSFGELYSPWIEKIEACIDNQQPFQLSYFDAANRQWVYNVCYAEFAFREKRNYLECWCDSTQGNLDLPLLRHNWSLRLDRIADAGIVSVESEWRAGLDTIEVEFELNGSLAHAYQPLPHDVCDQWLSVEPPRRRVSRRISNTFWFVREVLPYGKDCIVLSPEGVRSRILEHLSDAIARYKI